ncbi:MAG: PAS domain-containing protein [Oscillatoriales cyanobacterium C42_A2020_001]|nr:PAS domain-containing protein [Leptolyngbyaceae cyanobacterium C42_A2020_001]
MSAVLPNHLNHLAFIPPQDCYLWEPELMWLHALSDGLIAIAYFLIVIAFIYFVRQRQNLPYPSIFLLFGAFIVACGLTHVMEIWTLWHPTYWISGWLKSVAAVISLATAGALIPVIPQALTLPSYSEFAESRQRYQDLVENSPDIIERFDLQLRHLYVSPVLTKITGIATDTFMGKTCRELGMDNTMTTNWETAAAKLIATGEKQVIEFSTPTLIGERFFEMAIAPELSDQQTIKSILCISRDITERKQTETQLRDLSDRLRLAIQSAKMGIWDWDIATNRLTWDERIHELYRLPQSVTPTYQVWESVIHPDDFPHCHSTIQQALTDKNEGAIEFRVIKPDGTWRYLESYFLVQRDSSDRPLRLIGVNLDVSERKQAGETLKQQQELLQGIVDNIRMMLSCYDANNQLQWVNRTWQQTLGWTLEEARERDLLAEFYPDPNERTYVLQCIRAAEAKWEDFKIRLRNGTILDTSWANIRLSNGISIGIGQDISDRKQAEEARLQAEKLRLELNLLEHILDTVLAGYWDTNSPTASNYWSPGLKRMLGYEDHELPNAPDTWTKLMFAEDLPRVLTGLERHIQSHGAEPYYNEVRYHHKNGSTVWVICAGQVIEWDAAGQPLRMVGCHVDITKLKQTEAQLQKSEAHLKQAQRIGKLGSWEFDVATEKITWSEQVFHLFERDPVEGTPKSFEELQQLLYPDDRPLHQQTLQTILEDAQPYSVEFRRRRRDGTLAYIQSRGEAILDTTGHVIQLAGTALDITERKQAEAQLQMLSDRLTLALQAGVIGTWDWDLLEEVSWDARMYEIYGLQDLGRAATYHDWIGRVHPDDRKAVENVLQAAVAGEREYDVEFRIWRTDQTLRWIKAKALVQRDQAGNPLRMIGTNYDITEAKQAEAKLLQTTAQLEASNRELESFAYSVSHDLRAPLRAIDGFSKALLEDYSDHFDEEGTYYFNRIRHNVQRMGMLIDDLLSLSRVSRFEMQLKTVNLSALVQEQANDLQTAEPERQVEFVIAPDAIATADPTLMGVVISNLLANAWKFTSHHSSARIEFGIIKQDQQTTYFIRDDGAGFDMAYAAKLFGVFQRLHNTDEFPGTGIGLASVQRIIHRHGGEIWAKGSVEQGATIYFTIPEHRSESEPKP